MPVSTLDSLFETDLDIYELHVGVNKKKEDAIFFIRQSGNPQHEKLQRKMSKQLERARKNDKRMNELWAEIAAKTLISGWKGILDTDGNEMEASTQNKIDALVKHKRLLIMVMEAANDLENFQDDTIDLEDLEDEDRSTAEQDTEKN